MFKLRVLLIISAFTAVLSSGVFAYAPADEVSRALDRYEARADMGSPESSVADSEPPPSDEEWSAPKQAQDAPSSENPLSGRKKSEWEIGLETYGYEYEETVDGAHFMDLQGRFLGGVLNYTFRSNQLNPIEILNMFRFEFRYAKAKLDYNGGVQFSNGDSVPLKMSGVPDWVGEVRLLGGQDMPFRGMIVTPFTGFGIRRLQDDSSKVSGTFDNGGVPDTISGYRRISNYYYIPIGISFEKSFVSNWKARLTMEYDYFIRGTQASYSPVTITYKGVDYNYDQLKNDQNKGYGMRASLHLRKDMERYGFFVEPFFRYWNIDDSEWARFDGPPGYVFVGVGYEPANITREIGVKMGMIF